MNQMDRNESKQGIELKGGIEWDFQYEVYNQ